MWNVPCLPVRPWQITLVSLLMNTLALADMERAGCARANRRAERCMVKVGIVRRRSSEKARGCKLIISSLSELREKPVVHRRIDGGIKGVLSLNFNRNIYLFDMRV